MSEIKTPLHEFENKKNGDSIYIITEEHTFADIIRFLINQGCDKQEAVVHYDNHEQELLEEIFGSNPEPTTEEEKYDACMSEGRKIFLRQNSYGDAYAFHKAFEYVYTELSEKNLLP